MKDVIIMLKPASSLCNLRCKYCFYADVAEQRSIQSYGIMQPQTTKKILDHIFCDVSAGDHITFAFQGGEPTLAGLAFFQHFVQEANRQRGAVKIDYALQTNGMLLDESWCSFLKEHSFLTGLSLDAMKANHDAFRVDKNGHGTYKRVMAAKRLLDRCGNQYNVLMTLTNSLARHPQQTWNFVKENNIQYVQFIPCLGPLEKNADQSPYALTPQRFARFYKQLLTLWLADWEKGKYISVKLIDDLVNLLSKGIVTACGLTGVCSPQVVVESDGSVFPCDFYMLDCYKAGNLCEEPLHSIFSAPQMRKFACETQEKNFCRECQYFRMCGGGCKRMQRAVSFCEREAYCGYRDFLDFALQKLLDVARSAQKNY